MNKRGTQGFSLIELLIVIAIIGVIATLAVPALQRGVRAAELGNTFATLRTVSSTQMTFYSQVGRFGRLLEINNLLSNSVGTPMGDELVRGKFVFAMSPDPAPTDAQLREGYTITATRNVAGEGITYVYEVNQSGVLRQVLP